MIIILFRPVFSRCRCWPTDIFCVTLTKRNRWRRHLRHHSMKNIITEITPLRPDDCFYLVDRYKTQFDYPIHIHREIEINFIENCEGVRRIVGDSVETVGKYDLAMIGPWQEHVWEQHECQSPLIHEITIQFMPDMLGETFLNKTQLRSISGLLQRASHGVAFGMDAIMRNYTVLQEITREQSGFSRVLRLLELLHLLAEEEDCRMLASSSFSPGKESASERSRIHKVQDYVNTHFSKEIRLETAAAMIFMSPSSFSRYFKLCTGRTFSEYIIEIRLGNAARMLADTTRPIQEICYECGFNNISNFNRTFRRHRGCAPSEFRDFYRKTRVII